MRSYLPQQSPKTILPLLHDSTLKIPHLNVNLTPPSGRPPHQMLSQTPTSSPSKLRLHLSHFLGRFVAVSSSLGTDSLCIDETFIHSVGIVELVVGSLFDYCAVGHDDDIVGIFDCA